jgi:hypothetical protein
MRKVDGWQTLDKAIQPGQSGEGMVTGV